MASGQTREVKKNNHDSQAKLNKICLYRIANYHRWFRGVNKPDHPICALCKKPYQRCKRGAGTRVLHQGNVVSEAFIARNESQVTCLLTHWPSETNAYVAAVELA